VRLIGTPTAPAKIRRTATPTASPTTRPTRTRRRIAEHLARGWGREPEPRKQTLKPR